MNLISKQKRFSELVALLILKARELGYEVTFGEAWRPPETAAYYEKDGRGISNSLHKIRLAVDINLFKDGRFLQLSEEYKELGEYWESLSTEDCVTHWGGRFNDGNHFSVGHNGVK